MQDHTHIRRMFSLEAHKEQERTENRVTAQSSKHTQDRGAPSQGTLYSVLSQTSAKFGISIIVGLRKGTLVEAKEHTF
jgi:hypothetical protein